MAAGLIGQAVLTAVVDSPAMLAFIEMANSLKGVGDEPDKTDSLRSIVFNNRRAL